MKLYTKTGDKGTSGLLHGVRKPKTDIVFDVLGVIDELIAHIGVFRALCSAKVDMNQAFMSTSQNVQESLMDLGSVVAGMEMQVESPTVIENLIDYYESMNKPLTKFIIPGGCPLEAQMHVCRAVSRRLERLYLQLPEVDPTIQIFLNRLSDLFFAMARAVNTGTELYRS